jgi:tetratricopeptide (TPR) repeat protein
MSNQQSPELTAAWERVDKADELMGMEPVHYLKAVELYQEALNLTRSEQSSDISVIYDSLGEALTLLNRKEEALEIYRQGVARFPDASDLWYCIADLLIEKRDYPGAREANERCLALNPPYSYPWEQAAVIYAALHDEEQGRRAFLTALKRDPQLRKTAANDPQLTPYLHLIPKKQWWEFWK